MVEPVALRCAVYLEDPPLRGDAPGRGLARVNAALLAAVASDDSPILLVPMHGPTVAASWDARFADRLRVMPRWRVVCLKIADRWGGWIGRAVAQMLLRPAARVVRRSGAQALFAPVGANIGTAERALAVARLAHVDAVLYFVDDVVAAGRERGLSNEALDMLAHRVTVAVRRASQCFAITAALGDVLGRESEVAVAALPLPFEPRSAVDARDVTGTDVMHIGATNHIYARGLLSTARAMAEVNAADGAGLRLSLTAPPSRALREELEGLVPLAVVPANAPGELERRLAEALCAVVPVEAEPSGMYATSFPSKLLEYLGACRRIVVLGPDDASATRYFRAQNLDYVVGCTTELATALRSLLASRPDRSAEYREALRRTNDPGEVGRIVAGCLAAKAEPT